MRILMLLTVVLTAACGTTATDLGARDAAQELFDVATDVTTPLDVMPPPDATPPVDAPTDIAADVSRVEDAPTDVLPRDVSSGPNACVMRGGTCVPASRGGGVVPGFSLQCPPGSVTADGRQTWSGPGTDLLEGARIAAGCRPNDAGFEPALFGCCTPASVDAAADVSALDATAD